MRHVALILLCLMAAGCQSTGDGFYVSGAGGVDRPERAR